MKKNAKIKKNIEQRTTQPRTECGKSFQHDWHLYSERGGRKICHGDLIEKTRR